MCTCVEPARAVVSILNSASLDLMLWGLRHKCLVLQDVRMIFEMFDSNNDGTMDIAEFQNITDNLQRQGKQVGATRTGFKDRPEYVPDLSVRTRVCPSACLQMCLSICLRVRRSMHLSMLLASTSCPFIECVHSGLQHH